MTSITLGLTPFFWICALTFFAGFSWLFFSGFLSFLEAASAISERSGISPPKEVVEAPRAEAPAFYEVYTDGEYEGCFITLEEAVRFATERPRSAVRFEAGWIWDNYPDFVAFCGGAAKECNTFAEAEKAAGRMPNGFAVYRGSLAWDGASSLPDKAFIDVSPMLQFPELPRGCEVTSLSMLLSSQGIEAGKIELSKRIKKDETPYRIEGGRAFYGDPNVGFVGSMNDSSLRGYGVYHGPAFDLLREYLAGRALDLTGCGFDSLLRLLSLEIPVWVITNTSFRMLPDDSFTSWSTLRGEIRVTYKEHSVLMTGYDDNLIYFNCPLSGSSQADRRQFEDAWVQMGRQALSLLP
jgi:uncharacterized protein YvpB